MQYLRWFVVVCLIVGSLLRLNKEGMIDFKNRKNILFIIVMVFLIIAVVSVLTTFTMIHDI